MEWLDLVTGALSGGVTSLIGLGVQHYIDFKKEEAANKHALAMGELSLKEMDKELELAKHQGEIALEIEQEQGANNNLQAAILSQTETVKRASQWVVDVCAMTRPVLTLVLALATIVMIASEVNHPMLPQLIYMATTAVVYWFGDRARKK